jgi:hypothetical protein
MIILVVTLEVQYFLISIQNFHSPNAENVEKLFRQNNTSAKVTTYRE